MASGSCLSPPVSTRNIFSSPLKCYLLVMFLHFEGCPDLPKTQLIQRCYLSKALSASLPSGLHITILLSSPICAHAPSLPTASSSSYSQPLRSAWHMSLMPVPEPQVESPSLLPWNSWYALVPGNHVCILLCSQSV